MLLVAVVAGAARQPGAIGPVYAVANYLAGPSRELQAPGNLGQIVRLRGYLVPPSAQERAIPPGTDLFATDTYPAEIASMTATTRTATP